MKVDQKKAGVLLSYLAQIIHILSGILYTPIMLRLLGQSEYGLYQLVASVVSYLNVLSLGFGSSYMRFYSRIKKDGDEKKVASFNGMYLTVFLIIAFICMLCGIVLVQNIELVFGNGLTTAEYGKARVLLALMVFNLALTVYFSKNFASVTVFIQSADYTASSADGIWVYCNGSGNNSAYNCKIMVKPMVLSEKTECKDKIQKFSSWSVKGNVDFYSFHLSKYDC